MVTIEEFSKFDFRIAKIVDAQDHPNADKLVILKIDVGEKGSALIGQISDQTSNTENNTTYKQIVAGIKKSYSKNELIGKLIVVVNNLEPAVLRGVKSEGMLLAATDSEGLPILITPEKNVEPGAKVK